MLKDTQIVIKNSILISILFLSGAYVTLNCDPKWAHAVESVVAGLMTTFCCDNQKVRNVSIKELPFL